MDRPPHMPSDAELRDTLNYTIVALIAMIAGFILGCLFGGGVNDRPAAATQPAAMQPP